LSAFEYVLLAWGSANALVLVVALLLSSARVRRRSRRRRAMRSGASGQDAWPRASGQDAWS
jgi:hypothetical protein